MIFLDVVFIAKNVTVHNNCHVGATNKLVVEGEVIPDNTVVYGEGLRRTQQDMARVYITAIALLASPYSNQQGMYGDQLTLLKELLPKFHEVYTPRA